VWGTDKMPKCSQPVVLSGDRIFLSAGYQMGCEMVKVSKDAAGAWSTATLWRNLKMKTQFNSVTQLNEQLYGLDDGGMACMDTATGERLWKEGRYGAGQHVLLGDVALIQSERGPVVLAQLSPKGMKELSSSPMLSSKTWNYPTLAGNYLLVRNDQEVACYALGK
jgi:outer membrane protein assembly factor BamB